MPTRRAKPKVLISSTQRTVRLPRGKIAELIDFVARREGVRVAEVDLAVVAGGEMAGLNRRYLQRGGTTDVLSFDLSEAGRGGLSTNWSSAATWPPPRPPRGACRRNGN